eukprot:100050_1
MNHSTAHLINILASLPPESSQQVANLLQSVSFDRHAAHANIQFQSAGHSCSVSNGFPSHITTHPRPCSPSLPSLHHHHHHTIDHSNASSQHMHTMLSQFVPNSASRFPPNINTTMDRNGCHQHPISRVRHQPPRTPCSCPDVSQCWSIKRIVKLGIFYSKYGQHNAASIARFMSECTQFNSDYHHSMQYHIGSADKQKIAQMSRDYEEIFKSICIARHSNSHSVITHHDLLNYSQKMDTMYDGISTPENGAWKKIQQIHHSDIAVNSNVHRSDICMAKNNHNPNITHRTTSSQLRGTCAATPCYSRGKILHLTCNVDDVKPVQKPRGIDKQNLFFPTRKHKYNTINYAMSKARAKALNTPRTRVRMQLPELERVAGVRVNQLHKKIKPKVVAPRKYKCSLCPKQYQHLSNLKTHKRVHTDEALVCPHCQKRFGRKANYAEHLRIHTGDAPFECEHCHSKFKHRHSWKDHLRTHTGIKPYKCNICQRKFNTGSNLTVHSRMHTGERPYECQMCGHRFNQKSALNVHRRRLHRTY